MSPQWISLLDKLTYKRFGQESLAIEASEYVISKLSENNWARLKRCKDSKKLSSFLNVTTKNLIEEFARNKFGRPRPPTWLKRQGEMWVDIWKSLCLERQHKDAVILRFSDTKQKDASFIENIIRVIRHKMPWCGHSHQEIPQSCLQPGNEGKEEQTATSSFFESPDVFLDRNETNEMLAIISLILEVENGNKHLENLSRDFFAPDDTLKKLEAIQSRLSLDDIEIALLRMTYQSSLSKAVIARSMNLNRYEVAMIEKKALKKIRALIKEFGFNLTDLPKNIDSTAPTWGITS